jgi:hypothetical protein
LTTSISRVLQSLRLFSKRLNKPRARWTEDGIKRKIQKWLSAQFLADLIRYQLDSRDGQWRLQFDLDSTAFTKLIDHRLGRTVLLTNRMDWTAEQVVAGYAGQQQVERVFRGLKDGDWLGWGPMHHWTDRKIRIHAFYCMLGISLLQVVHRHAKAAWADLFMEALLEELRQNSAVCSALSAARRQGTGSRSLCAFEADLGATSFGEGTEVRRTADCPTWVRQGEYSRLHKNGCLQASLLNWQ